MMDLLVNFLFSVIASLVAVVVVLYVERLRKPSLGFEIEDRPPESPHGRRFLRVYVRNRPINPRLGFFVNRHPALMCQAFLTFLTTTNDPLFEKGHRMIGRWASTPEPVQTIVDSGAGTILKVRDPARLRHAIDIPADGGELLDVVMRSPTGESCYGWHNGFVENPDPRPEDIFELRHGRYHILIRVRTGGEDFKHVYRIVNDVPVEHFRLEELSPQPKLGKSL